MLKKGLAALLLLLASHNAFAAWGAKYDLDAVPLVPDGFKVQFFAKEPDLLHAVCLAFDAKGRMFVGGGPQFRWPKPDTPKDFIKICIDKDGDGKAEEFKIFAEGFNCIQALAWKGNDLWVCHAPAVTIIRDLDGDDAADEFVDVFTDLGPLRHGLHGFNWAPDGKLYMSQGDNTCTKDAPKVWRDLMHVQSDAPAEQSLRKYTRAEWKTKYLEPYNTQTEGGVIRCDPDGKNAEIWARGMRNPWDIAFDDTFTWSGGDNDDGPESDRVFHMFHGAHYGKRHAWSYSWSGENNPCTVPISGLFPHANGSAVGVIYYTAEHFPPEWRNGFFMGDSDGERVYFYRQEYDGALMKTTLKEFAWTKEIGKGALFMPTDVEAGPDGALYVVGWGSTYGSKWAPYHKGRDENAKLNEGRVFRMWYDKGPLISKEKWYPAKRSKKYEDWTFEELMEDMGHQIPVWRVNAQDEIVRRGAEKMKAPVQQALESGKLTTGQETWTIWALGRMSPGDKAMDSVISSYLSSKNFNQRLQAIRILSFRKASQTAPAVAALLTDKEPRVRFEAAQSLWHMPAKDQLSAIQAAAATETDRLTFYSLWRSMSELMTPDALKPLLKDERAGVRRAALLALLETSSLKSDDVLTLLSDKDKETQKVAVLWLTKLGKDLPADKLLALLSESSVETRAAVLQCLSRTKLDKDGFARLNDFLPKTAGEERALTLKAMASNASALEILWNELNSKEEIVMNAAIEGLSAQEQALASFVFAKLENASPQQRDGGLIALASLKKFEWSPDEARMKALQSAFNSTSMTTRRATMTLLSRAKNLKKAPGAKIAEEIAKKAATDPDKNVKELAVSLAKSLGVELAQTETVGTQAEQVMPLLAKADPKRGQEIFFRKDIPGCYNCHHLEGKGVAVGPDLSDIALRADARNILESIFEPSKAITEGFQPTMVKTNDGQVISGVVKEDSDEVLVIYEATGKATEIRKALISVRKTLNVSFMPDNFPELLKPQEAADLVSYLLTMKTKKADAPAPKK
ncbi:MAG TPA: PVC-type heme-binding CxxCH protein [Planctomycetota bacterium]|nr:PVC-type heme-binding CxxCH protein [Planctomycetota bacterium]